MNDGTDAKTGYGRFARILHWTTLVLIAVMLSTGYLSTQLRTPGPMPPFMIARLEAGGSFPPSVKPNDILQDQVAAFHKTVGLTILLLTLARLVYRRRVGVPPEPAMPAWQRTAARTSHSLLYVGLIAMPLLGWYASSAIAAHHGFYFLGLIYIPPIAPLNVRAALTALTVHAYLAWTLLGLITLHAGAALYHHYVLRDGVLSRMASGREEAPLSKA